MQNTEKWIETFIVPDPDIEQLAITEDSYPLNMALHQEDPIRLEEYGYVAWRLPDRQSQRWLGERF